MRNTRWMAGLALVLAFGCGGDEDSGPGIDEDKQLAELSSEEKERFCEWQSENGPTEAAECEGGSSVGAVGTLEECVDGFDAFPSDCDLTVGQMMDCTESLAEDPCEGIASPECGPLLDCLSFDPQ